MKQGQALNIFAVSALALTVAGGWYFREPLGQTLGKSIVEQAQKSANNGGLLTIPGAGGKASEPAVGRTAAPAPTQQTVYRWVDADGVTHYDQQGGAGREAVSFDSGDIQRLEDLTPATPSQP